MAQPASEDFIGDDDLDGLEPLDENQSDDLIPLEVEELSSTQVERREDHAKAVLVGFGETSAFSGFGLRYLQMHSNSSAWSIGVGTGRYQIRSPNNTTVVTASSKFVSGRIQWWPSDVFPLALVTDVGLQTWSFKGSCVTGDLTGRCVQGSGNAQGLSTSAGIMFSWISEYQYMIEWSVLCGRKAHFFKYDFEGGDGQHTIDAVEDYHRKFQLMSLANFAVGYRF